MEGSDSTIVNGTEEMGNKRLKFLEEEDRISALPDSVIHYILSFLPSTKEAIQTGILSKQWRNQWSCVPVLIFDFRRIKKDYARFIDNILLRYDCLKIKKFHIAYNVEGDTNLTSKILFATSRNVEELILEFYLPHINARKEAYMLPKFIFHSASLVQLQILNFEFQLSPRINLPSLKVLKLDCYFLKDSGSIGNVLSGCPSLESLEIQFLTSVNHIIIASKSLKILIFADIIITHDLEISCPNLQELSVTTQDMDNYLSVFPDKTLLSLISGSPFLYSLEILDLNLDQLVIASKSLKKLVVDSTFDWFTVEISCPNLKELYLCCSDVEHCKLMNLPSSCCTTLYFFNPMEGSNKILARKILTELQQVKQLEVGSSFLKVLSGLKTEELSNPVLNVKSLTLRILNVDHILGIVNVLHYLPMLETLVIKLLTHQFENTEDLDLKILEESYWTSKGTVFTCLAEHLKTVEISSLSKKDLKCNKVILCFIEFLLKTAGVLENMTLVLSDDGPDFQVEVSQTLLGYPRCSQQCHCRVVVI